MDVIMRVMLVNDVVVIDLMPLMPLFAVLALTMLMVDVLVASNSDSNSDLDSDCDSSGADTDRDLSRDGRTKRRACDIGIRMECNEWMIHKRWRAQHRRR